MLGIEGKVAGMPLRIPMCLVLTFLALGAEVKCRAEAGAAAPSSTQGHNMPFILSSRSFSKNASIPKKFTCDGADVSPELSWNDPPNGTVSLALIADDPDAPVGTWTHWVLFDLPPETRSLSEGVPKTEQLANGARQGRNDFPKIGYNGPCPPPGKPHRYFFKLYALDTRLSLKAGASKQEVERAMHSHVLASAEWMGQYGR